MSSSGGAAPGTAWKPLILCPDRETLRGLRGAFQDVGIVETVAAAEYPRPGMLAEVAAQHSANLCLIDVATEEARALELIGESPAGVAVVALNVRQDADLILRCLRRGAVEFLSDTSAETLRGVLERLGKARAAAPQPRKAKVYCVIPAKPGSGASTLALHIAVEMGAAPGVRVLLIDADPFTASIRFMLKLKSEFHIGDALRDWKRMDDDMWRRLASACCGIDVMAGPETPSLALEIDRRMAGELLAFWRERYDVVVVDAPDLRGAAESGLAALADEALLVTTNELAALHAARRAIDFLDRSGADRARVRLIVNRYSPDAGLRSEDLKTALPIAPLAVIGNHHEALQTALLEGKAAAPESQFRSGIRRISELLRGGRAADRKEKRRFGFLRRRN